MRLASWYGIAVGILVVVQWAFFLATGSVPELRTAPWSIAFHLAAELVMAASLVAGGIAVRKSLAWGRSTLLVALGTAIYSEIASAGYFAQQGTWPLVAIFAVLLAGALIGVRGLASGQR